MIVTMKIEDVGIGDIILVPGGELHEDIAGLEVMLEVANTRLMVKSQEIAITPRSPAHSHYWKVGEMVRVIPKPNGLSA